MTATRGGEEEKLLKAASRRFRQKFVCLETACARRKLQSAWKNVNLKNRSLFAGKKNTEAAPVPLTRCVDI